MGLLEEDPLPPGSLPLTANWVDEARFLQKVYNGRLTCGTSKAAETAERRNWVAWGPQSDEFWTGATLPFQTFSASQDARSALLPAPVGSDPEAKCHPRFSSTAQLWLSTTVAGAALGNPASLNRETKRMVM